ncbi:autotransporter-associated beta strand repeat-containing protein [Variovorax sp. EBFNA2]|uniref:autotransporter-associated beta strand repeat-containing protein n=1 Tax=Variovorax sp. EBFNA2 TaxID=3342097 RepID=UPI0029BFCB5B|nr:autotransporter-associated beta strand repeat-containing protein [Variovorax boronicumulans]WPG41451.1 autotransporter outer membrane beta-barrel domain-containing protein [Variovorax boronicumulans]
MNTAYKTLWNAALGAWVAVCETAPARGKRSGGRRASSRASLVAPLVAVPAFLLSGTAWAACTLTGTTLDCAGVTPGWVGVADGGTINNTGTIATLGDGTWAINVGSNVTVNNTGTIHGTAGVVTGGNSVINNNGGTISSTDRAVQVTGGPVTLTNSNGGVIEGSAGALLYGGGTIVNTGNSRITSNGNYLGLGFGGGSANITNTAGSTIEGIYSIYGQATAITLDNGGLLRGHVALDGGLVQWVTLRTGSRVQGNLTIGNRAGSTLTLAGAGTQIHSQAVTGVTDFGGDLIKNDSGDWIVDRAIGPRTATVNGGALGFASGGSFGTGTALSLAAAGTMLHTDSGTAVVGNLTGVAGSMVALAAGSSLRMADDSSTTVASDFSGGGTLIKSGIGVLTLSGNNSAFTGSFTANAGTLQAASAQAIGGAALGIGGAVTLSSPFALALNNVDLISGSGVLDVQTPGAVSFGGVVSGAGSLDLRGIGGTVSLLNNNSYAGGTRLAGSTVVLGSNTALGTGTAAIEGNTALSGNAALTLGNAFAIGKSNTLSISGPALTLDGQISGDGAIVKQGVDVLTLRGDNSYSGGTTVAMGTLSVSNKSGSATGTGAVQVQSGAALVGSGAIAGPVNVAAGARLSVGNGGVGALATGALTLAAGSTLEMEMGKAGKAGGAFNDLLNVNGDLSLAGTLDLAQSAGGTFGAGIYRLINYTGALTANAMTIGSAPTPLGYLALQTGVANQINLVNTGGLALNMWDGNKVANFNNGQVEGGSGTWRAGSPGDNWTDANGIVNAGWIQDGLAVFTGKAGTVAVDNTGAGGAVRIGGAQFAVDGYVVNGDPLAINAANTTVRVGDGTAAGAGMTATINAAIGGTGGLVKDDGGTLVLTGNNSYMGGTSVKGGILQISGDANLGAIGTGLALDGGTLRIATGSTPFFSMRNVALGAGGGTIDLGNSFLELRGVVSGSGLFTVTGKGGSLSLVAANSYSGGTVLKDGASIVASAGGVFGGGAVQQQGDGTVLAFTNAASAGGNDYIVGRAATADNGNVLSFAQTTTAATSKITVNGGGWQAPGVNILRFGGSSSAGASTIVNAGGGIGFLETASAGTATITNGSNSLLVFGQKATAGSAQIANTAGGLVLFADTATGTNASVTNAAGATLDVSGATGGKPAVELGSLTGAGAVVLGATQLALGGLGNSDTISGTVSDKGSIFAQPGSGTGGSIVKVGAGTLTLSGANSYTGGTTVAAGTLAVNNVGGSATGTGAVQVQSGATLAGIGSIAGAVSVGKGGQLSAGNGGAGTLTLGSLSLADGAVLNYDLGQAGVAGGSLNDLVNVNGNLQLDGTLNVAESTGGKFGAGLYRLINYTGTLTDNGLDIGTAPTDASKMSVQTSVANQINLVNSNGLVLNLWDGVNSGNFNDGKIAGGSGTWRAGVPGDSWTDANGTANGTWVQGGFAIFAGKAGTVTVDNTGAGGAVRIGGAQFAVDGYTIDGAALTMNAPVSIIRVGDGTAAGASMTATINAAITGAGGLVKDDVGTLVLGGSNSYTGGTTVKGGTLQIASDANLGAAAGGLALQGGATLHVTGDSVSARAVSLGAGSNTFDIDAVRTVALNGTASGAGSLRKTGAGTLRLGAANSHAGGTFVDAGTLATEVTGALGSGAATVATGATLQLGGGFDAGTTAIGNQGKVRFQDKSSAGTSTITNAAGGVLAFAGDASADKATVINQAGAQVRIDQATTGVSFGALSGAGDVVLGAKALTLGGSGGDNSLSGTVSGTGGSVVKIGAGTLVLTGANTYTGATTVAAGTLRVNNTSGSGTGTGSVQVQSGATLAGSGSIAGAVTIAKGGILAAGNSPGTLTLGALTLAGGSTLNYELGQAGVPGGALNDLINVTGNLQLDGTLNIAQSAGGTFGPGLYRLMSYGGTLTDFGLDIGTAPAGAKLADLQVQTSVANQVNLVNRAGLSLNFWDGGDSSKYNDGQVAGGNGTWRLGSPQPSQDGWTDMDGKLNANWAQNQFAVFGGKAGTVTVDGGGGAVRIAGVQFAVDGYTVQGDGITLDNANSVIRVGDGTAAGANMTATMNVALSGTGGISKEDAGRLILGGANTYTGGTTVKGGVLQGSATSLQGSIVNNAEVAFDQDKTAGIYAGVMSGTGKLRKIGAGTLTLASANSYSGGTLVDAGTLATATSGALGTGAVSIASGAALQFGGKADAGKLAIANQGTLRLQDGANAASATVANAAGAQVRIDLATTGASIGALGGAGDVVLGAKALTTGAVGSDSTISGAITGAGGSLVKVGAGTLTLAGTASYSGETRVAAGTLKAGAANAFSAASNAVVASGATLDLAGFSQTVAGLANSGTVALAGAAPGTTLTVKGNYVGNNGVLKLGTVLNGGAGPSDRLVIDGGAASGKTSVQIANIGGLGARTSGAGIEVVSARNGATTTAQTTKDAFVLAGGHVDAGAFEYRLHAGDASGGGENWYLRTEAEPGTPGNPGGTGLPTYRAEASLFAALPNQLRQSNLGMLASRSQRVGDDDVRGGASSTSGTDGSYRRAWGRLISTDMGIRQGGTVSPHSEGRLTGLQAGTDLWANPDWRAGIYVGQLDGDARVRGVGSGLLNSATGRNDLRSQYLGLYGTFATEDGFYADAVLQAGRHRYTVQPLLSGGVEGKGNSFLASIEVGKAFAIGSGGWSVEPQLQLIHQRLRLDDVSIPGALVQQDADSGWIGRAGVRIKGSFATGAGTLQPYVRLNVYRSAKGNDVARFVNPAAITPVGAPIGGTSTELAAGFTLSVSQRTSLYGELGKQWASGGDARVGSSINAAAGVRVKW